MARTITLIREDHAERPALDTAVARAMLLEVSEGSRGETLRIHRPARVVAFGRQDVVAAGYSAAVRAARQAGFEAIERLAGGRAAVFHAETISFSWTIPEPDPKITITPRFVEIAEIVRSALETLGVDARIGEVPGEYCPGAYSVNAEGNRKLMGVGQRLTRRAAHIGGVVVVSAGRDVRDVLIPVYEALDLVWDPQTVGAVTDHAPDATFESTTEALVAAFADRYDIVHGVVGGATIARAEELESDHLAP